MKPICYQTSPGHSTLTFNPYNTHNHTHQTTHISKQNSYLLIGTMLTTTTHNRHHAFEKSPSHMKNIDRKLQAMSHASKYLQRIYPLGIQRTSSNLTLSSLSLSQNSNDSSLSSSNSSWEPKVPLLYGGTFSPWGDVLVSLERRREDDKVSDHDVEGDEEEFDCSEPGSLHRCSWITKNSDEAYVQFHDECWGVPVYNDKYDIATFLLVFTCCMYHFCTSSQKKSALLIVHLGFIYIPCNLQPSVRATSALRDAHRPQLDRDTQEKRHVQGSFCGLRSQRGGENGRERRRRNKRQQGAQAGGVQSAVHRRERQDHTEGGEGVWVVQRVHLGARESPADGGQVQAPQVHPVPDPQVGGGEQGPRPAGLPACRPRHRLLLHAGLRHGHRPPRRLLPLPGVRPPRRALVGHH